MDNERVGTGWRCGWNGAACNYLHGGCTGIERVTPNQAPTADEAAFAPTLSMGARSVYLRSVCYRYLLNRITSQIPAQWNTLALRNDR